MLKAVLLSLPIGLLIVHKNNYGNIAKVKGIKLLSSASNGSRKQAHNVIISYGSTDWRGGYIW